MALDLHIGDTVQMKKIHPCGNDHWEVTRLGADIGLVCQGCRHYVLMPRTQLTRRIKAVEPGTETKRPGAEDTRH